jgi:hypothetical protein
LGTDAFRPSTVLVLLVVAAGVGLRVAGRDGTVPAGLAGLLWMSSSLCVWYLGVRVQRVLPQAVLPNGAAVEIGPGVLIAIVGGALAFVAACGMVGYRTWRPDVEARVPIVSLSAAVAVGLVSLWARGFRWLQIDGRRFHWALGSDAVPGIGDGVAVAVVALLGGALTLAITPRRWLAVAVVVLGAIVALLAALVGLTGVALRHAAERAISSLGLFEGDEYEMRVGIGPWVLVGAGLASAAYGVARLRHVGHRR